MEGIARPIGHVVKEIIVFEHDERILVSVVRTEAEVWILDMNDAARSANILAKHVVCKDYSADITPDHER